MRSYHHFTQYERESLRFYLEKGMSYREIARRLGRNVSTISREIKRNGKKDGSINAVWGSSLYAWRRKRCRRIPRIAKDPGLKKYIEEKLHVFWSPEAITACWKKEHPEAKLSHSTLYRALRDKQLEDCSEQKHLRRRGKLKYKNTGSTGLNPVKPDHTIAEWPKEIRDRARIGDWEGDTIRGKNGQGYLFTAIDRKSRYIVLGSIPGKRTKEATAEAVCEALRGQVVNSLTLDNGTEFAAHREIAQRLDTTVYFADPAAPWQRGSNENANGILRFFFPKGCDLRSVTQEELNEVMSFLNNRPRKCLGWLSPVDFLKKCCT